MRKQRRPKVKKKNKWVVAIGLIFAVGTVTKLYLSYRVRAIDGFEGIVEGSSDEVIIMCK